MPGIVTEVTEIATALGTLAPDLWSGFEEQPPELANVPVEVWRRLQEDFFAGRHKVSFVAAFENGAALLRAEDGLRGRRPRLIEWKGAHRPPGDDVIPAELRIDHVYLVSCKYLSKVLLNAGPARLFDRLLTEGERPGPHWFDAVAPEEFAAFYRMARAVTELVALPRTPAELTTNEQRALAAALSSRVLPASLREPWAELCAAVAARSTERWSAGLSNEKTSLRLLWRLLRVSNASYFVLGADRSAQLRLRVLSMWDWHQAYELAGFAVAPRDAGQPEVAWSARVRDRRSGLESTIAGHVEIRWSHGRFVGSPEAKVYLDTPHREVAGYEPLG